MPAEYYRPRARQLQDEFDTRRLADRVFRLVHPSITEENRAFIEARDMFFLATVDEEGFPSCSYKGGEPGFVKVLDEQTIAFPSYNGNGMFLSMGNIDTTHQVGLLFIDFIGQSRLRVNGEASIDPSDPLMESYAEADLVVRVRVREVFPNCPRYIHKMQLVQPSRFVPREGCETPVPAWKKLEWAADALPEGDPAMDPSREILAR